MTASAAASSISRMHSAIANLRARFSSTFTNNTGENEENSGSGIISDDSATNHSSSMTSNYSSFNHENSHTHRKLVCSNQNQMGGQHPGTLSSVPLKFTQNILSRELSTDSVLSTCSTTDLNFRICGVSDYNQVIDFLYPNFHRDEPMSKSLDLVGPEMEHNEVLDEFALHGLQDNMSIAAFDASTGKLLGICINVIERSDDKEEDFSDNPKFAHIMEVLRRVNERSGDLFRQFNTNTLFTIKMVSTDKVNRKAGLGSELLRRSMDLSKALGFKAIKTEATGMYSRKAFTKLGFDINAEYKYKDYVVDGQAVFEKVEEPHRMITVMSKPNV